LPAEVYGYSPAKAQEERGLPEGRMGILCGVQLEWGRQEVRYLERGRQGRGNEFPLPVGPTPNGDIPTVQHMGRSRRRAGHGCSPDIATHGPCPRKGAGEERRRRGWGGGCWRGIWVSFAEGRGGIDGKQDGLSLGDRGGGTSSPSPSALPPMAISPRSSTWGDPGEELSTVAHRLHPGHGCSPDIASTALAPPGGRGRSAAGAGGVGAAGRSVWVSFAAGAGGVGAAGRSVWVSFAAGAGGVGDAGRSVRVSFAEGAGGAGAAGRSVWVLPRKSRRSKGASELHRYPPAKARAGWGLPAEAYGYSRGKAGGVRVPANCIGILCRRHGWGGAAGKERMDIPSRTRRRRRQYSSLGTGPNVFWNSWQHYRV